VSHKHHLLKKSKAWRATALAWRDAERAAGEYEVTRDAGRNVICHDH